MKASTKASLCGVATCVPLFVALASGTVFVLSVLFPNPMPAIREAIAKACFQHYEFAPRADITAYDLARILSRMSGPPSGPICVSEEKPIPDDLLPQFRSLQ